MTEIRLWLALPIALAMSACSTQVASEPAPAEKFDAVTTHPVSGLRVVPLTIQSGAKTHRFRVEVAATLEQQMKGLMFRTEMPDNEGMIFPYEYPQPHSFWMKNTPLSLDIIFVAMDGTIRNIAADTVPYSLDPVVSDGVVRDVLELRGGTAAKLGIKPGDKVSFPRQ